MTTKLSPRELVLKDHAIFQEKIIGASLYEKQQEMVRAVFTEQRVTVSGANGCIAPETRIENADTGELIPVADITGEFPVWSIDGENVVRSISQKPFIKRRTDLYRVTLKNGATFLCTLDHRLRTSIGWVPLRSLLIGDSVAISSSHSDSSSFGFPQNVFSLSIPEPYGCHCWNKSLNSQVCYLHESHSYDEQPLEVLSNVQEFLPLQDGVPGRSDGYRHKGDQVYGSKYNPIYPLLDRHSKTHYGQMEPQFLVSEESQGEPLSFSRAHASNQVVLQANQILSSCVPQEMASRLGPSHEFDPSGFEQHAGEIHDSYFNPTYIFSSIHDIRFERVGQFYDLHVPGTENYLAEGVFHHNTGKDFTAARIALQWLSMYEKSKVIVIAPTHRQVETIFWNELRSAYASKCVSAPWGFRIFPGSARIEADVNPHERFGIGFATRNPAEGSAQLPTGQGLQGYHSPHLLAIISEAHGVQQSHIDEIRRLNPQCLLLTGNPFSAVGEFYDSHHSKANLYRVIQI
ncbi:MAG TPA: hypothetical protein ENI27_04685, partial [bacterium]|nr:hypothetical protein [bacterium]